MTHRSTTTMTVILTNQPPLRTSPTLPALGASGFGAGVCGGATVTLMLLAPSPDALLLPEPADVVDHHRDDRGEQDDGHRGALPEVAANEEPRDHAFGDHLGPPPFRVPHHEHDVEHLHRVDDHVGQH